MWKELAHKCSGAQFMVFPTIILSQHGIRLSKINLIKLIVLLNQQRGQNAEKMEKKTHLF